MYAAIACLLLGVTDYSKPVPLPDVPPGLPCSEECIRRHWQLWRQKDAYEQAAERLPESDRVLLGEMADHLYHESYAWWHAGLLVEWNRSEDNRAYDRNRLIELIGYDAYRSGQIEGNRHVRRSPRER